MAMTWRIPNPLCGSSGRHAQARTAAMSAPRGMVGGMLSRPAFEISLFLWGTIVVNGPGTGIIAFVALLWPHCLGVTPTVKCALMFVASVFITLFVLIPMADPDTDRPCAVSPMVGLRAGF